MTDLVRLMSAIDLIWLIPAVIYATYLMALLGLSAFERKARDRPPPTRTPH